MPASAPDMNSMVTVSNINTYNSFVLGVDSSNKLYIGQLDNNFPQKLVDTVVRFFLLPTTYGKIFLTGGFFDEDDKTLLYMVMEKTQKEE